MVTATADAGSPLSQPVGSAHGGTPGIFVLALAVLGLGGAEASAETAAQITVPVEFLVQWDDERVPRTQSLTLFDALASAEKTLHANVGRHGDLPSFETDSSLRFFARHLR